MDINLGKTKIVEITGTKIHIKQLSLTDREALMISWADNVDNKTPETVTAFVHEVAKGVVKIEGYEDSKVSIEELLQYSGSPEDFAILALYVRTFSTLEELKAKKSESLSTQELTVLAGNIDQEDINEEVPEVQ